jgi:hypothetical protein
MVQPRMAATNNWSFDKIFHDDDFIAAGQMIIPPRGLKPSKEAKDNTFASFQDPNIVARPYSSTCRFSTSLKVP